MRTSTPLLSASTRSFPVSSSGRKYEFAIQISFAAAASETE